MTFEEIKEKNRLTKVRRMVREFILVDKLDRAEELCSKNHLVLNDCLLDAVYGAPEVITKKELPEGGPPVNASLIVEDPPHKTPLSRLPVVAEVYSKPINPRLIGIILPDGSKSLLWKTNNHSIGSKVVVELEEEVGDTSYYRESSKAPPSGNSP